MSILLGLESTVGQILTGKRQERGSCNLLPIGWARAGEGGTDPSPVRAQQPWICHGWSLMALSVRNWEISAVVMESFTSCLLAKISTEAS